jgi:hypothetical protein
LSGRLVFTPATDALGPYYRVTGTGKLDGLVLPALTPRGYRVPSANQPATGVVAPTGFDGPTCWPEVDFEGVGMAA